LALAAPADAQLNQGLPKELEGVGVTEHPGVQIPLDLEFTNSDGAPATLGDYFDGARPVILTMNYSNCPKLCSVQLNALVDAMRKMPWDLGDQYRVLTVTIDPLETPERAALTRQKYLQDYGRAGAGGGWNFLVGPEENIKRLAETVGFGYAYLPDSKEYVHAAVLIICMPDGQVSRYIYKVEYDPQTLRLSLVEAGQGEVGSPMDQILLYCFHYSSTDGRYTLAAYVLMRIGGVLTLVVFGSALSVWWVREKRKARAAQAEAAS
jgi:protein SCO1/2